MMDSVEARRPHPLEWIAGLGLLAALLAVPALRDRVDRLIGPALIVLALVVLIRGKPQWGRPFLGSIAASFAGFVLVVLAILALS
jgi:hypothetical protein